MYIVVQPILLHKYILFNIYYFYSYVVCALKNLVQHMVHITHTPNNCMPISPYCSPIPQHKIISSNVFDAVINIIMCVCIMVKSLIVRGYLEGYRGFGTPYLDKSRVPAITTYPKNNTISYTVFSPKTTPFSYHYQPIMKGYL